jgi:hypothetical protein
MGVKVKILERDFATGTPNIYYKVFPDADTFDVLMNQTQEQTHLRIVQESQQIAFFPSGGWLGVELIKER